MMLDPKMLQVYLVGGTQDAVSYTHDDFQLLFLHKLDLNQIFQQLLFAMMALSQVLYYA